MTMVPFNRFSMHIDQFGKIGLAAQDVVGEKSRKIGRD